MSAWFRDGRPCDTVSTADRGLHYGDGLFETVAIRDAVPRLWSYHVERLQSGAARLGLPVPSGRRLRSGLDLALQRAPADPRRCLAKIVLTAGAGPRGYRRSGDTPSTLLTGIFDAHPVAPGYYRDGIELRLCRTRLAVQPQLAGMKTLNRLEQVLARNEWRDERVFEGLLLDTGDRLICGTMSNVFLIEGQELVTPAITRCGVSGVMRRHLLTLLDTADIGYRVGDVGIDDLWASDGVFISNSQFGILPVRRCGAHSWQPPDAFRRLASMLERSGIEEGAA